MTQRSTIESAVRDAVTTGNYEQAALLLSDYCQQLQTELQGSSLQGDQLAEEMRHTKDLLDWIFRLVSAARAHDSARLNELLSASRYRGSEADPLHIWKLEG